CRERVWDGPGERPPKAVRFGQRGGGSTNGRARAPVEAQAYKDLARQLAAGLDRDASASCEPVMTGQMTRQATGRVTGPPAAQPAGLEGMPLVEPPAHDEGKRNRALLDLLPTGVLIYRLGLPPYSHPRCL